MSDGPDLIRLTSPDGGLSAFVAPTLGGELCGLEWRGRELLWRGRDFSHTAGWTGRAPVLWPAIGRTFAPGAEPTADTYKQAPLGWSVDGRLHEMPMHGFTRSLPLAVVERSSTQLSLSLKDSDQTRVFYPFGFRHLLTFTLTDGGLMLEHLIDADAANPAPMPFALGNHATFHVARDTRLVSNATHRLLLDAAGRPTGGMSPFTTFAQPAPVSRVTPFEVIPLAVQTGRPQARLIDRDGLSITVAHAAANPAHRAMEFITVWGDPGAAYLSLEPWLGKPNALASGDGVVRLPPGQSFGWAMTIDIAPDVCTDLSL